MKNKLGIEVKCENCDSHYRGFCDDYWCRREKGNPKKDFRHFAPSNQAYKARIKELQEQLKIFENAYHKSLDAYHNVAEQLEELKARSESNER